ncbi:MAG: hypothetical protein EA423_03110 [Phycisphaerales bacterium]|nr:MAG: hypothetical protein EA423_03110 [Phycisphaerales bacterium]
MAVFRFKLEAVLRQRRLVEDERRKRVAELDLDRLAIEREIEGHQAQIIRERNEMASILVEGGSGTMMRVQAGAALRLRAKIGGASVRLAGVLANLEKERAALRKAAADRKAIELLKEQRLLEWKKELMRRESAELDEFAVMRAARSGEYR